MICNIVTSWRLYKYTLMQMSIVMASDVFQERLAGFFTHLSHVLVYIYDIAIIGYNTFDKHLQDVNEVVNILRKLGMQVNPAKYIWAKE